MSTPDTVEAAQPKGLAHLREYIPIKLIVVVLVIFGLVKGYQWIQNDGDTTVNAYFANADGLYTGDDVKVLGVGVGKITDIHPEDSDVRVTLRIDSGVKIPANTSAAIVSPSLVSGRYVQLSPYTSGARLSSGSSIPLSRTAVPLSFDDVKSELTQLSSTLAPQGSTSQPLRDTINGLQASLRAGNADALRSAIQGLQTTATTLADGKGDLFSTISNLNSFTQNLAINDAAVSGFTHELSSVSAVLAANRHELTTAVATLANALGSTGTFLKTNRARINTSIKDLNLLGAALADRSNQLAGVLHVAPTVILDLYNVIENQALTARASLTGLKDPAQLICGALLGVGGTAQQCRNALAPLLALQAAAKQSAARSGGPNALGCLSAVTSFLSGLLGSLGGHL